MTFSFLMLSVTDLSSLNRFNYTIDYNVLRQVLIDFSEKPFGKFRLCTLWEIERAQMKSIAVAVVEEQ